MLKLWDPRGTATETSKDPLRGGLPGLALFRDLTSLQNRPSRFQAMGLHKVWNRITDWKPSGRFEPPESDIGLAAVSCHQPSRGGVG